MRLLHLMSFMAALCPASTKRVDVDDRGNSSSDFHDHFNRSVLLNNASEYYLGMIFEEYADNLTEIISAKRFKDLLHDLKLGEAVVTSGQVTQKDSDSHHRHTRSLDGPSREIVSRFAGQQTKHRHRGSPVDELNLLNEELQRNSARSKKRNRRNIDENRNSHEKCAGEQDLLRVHGVNETEGVSEDDFVRICPSLIHQLYKGACNQEKHQTGEVEEGATDKMLHVWGYGVLSITVISLTSLLAIAVIPLIGRSFYKKLMSFLVALAVGTLAGDALLHLIPHAYHVSVEDAGGHEGHKMNIYKSCVIMAGIYMFFMVECIMKARLSRKSQGQENSHACDDVISPDNMSLKQKKKYAEQYKEMVGSRLAGIQRRVSCDGAYFPKDRNSYNNNHKQNECALHIETGKEERASSSSESFHGKVPLLATGCHGDHLHQRDGLSEKSKQSFSDTELVAVMQAKFCIHRDIYTNSNLSASASDTDSQAVRNVNQIQCYQGNKYTSPVPSVTTTTTTEISSDNGDQSCEEEDHHGPHNHHHHNHHHSHSIDENTSIATVAWMVIVGDGFHNFSDGLAVGAAFSASLTSGLTTAIAVFCHELPHELGDFAILLKSGLTFRQAVTYNFASAIISYIGLILGIIIGDIQSAHTWVLALTAGMFLYISLVDMLPELSTFIQEGGGWSVVLSQNLGILAGVSIMLVIALYER